ncbi:TetR family transcriptional regulator [Candidatus Poriferisocius sp.]|uniref:TetR/AcrR family transcriptional regulator n=1 Tax=Candidatus Poriferisocius sp. TaxID=3101276 RepID=UPI003B52A28B
MGETGERPRNLPVQERAVLTRDRILQAATEVITQEGVSSLTLDKVAARAGVSKGGFLYHFGSKDALIIGLLNQVMGVLDNELNVLAEGIDSKRGAFALAYLDYVREPTQAATDTAVSILAAAAVDDDLLDSTRATFQRWQNRLRHDDGVEDVQALLARIVGDGLWLIDLFGLAPPTAEERRKVLDLVSNMITAHGAASKVAGSAE